MIAPLNSNRSEEPSLLVPLDINIKLSMIETARIIRSLANQLVADGKNPHAVFQAIGISLQPLVARCFLLGMNPLEEPGDDLLCDVVRAMNLAAKPICEEYGDANPNPHQD